MIYCKLQEIGDQDDIPDLGILESDEINIGPLLTDILKNLGKKSLVVFELIEQRAFEILINIIVMNYTSSNKIWRERLEIFFVIIQNFISLSIFEINKIELSLS